jgi:YD repeat-containing protein
VNWIRHHLRRLRAVRSACPLLAQVAAVAVLSLPLSDQVHASGVCSPSAACNPASGHELSRLTISDGMAGYRQYVNLTTAGVSAALLSSCAFFAEGHSIPGPHGYTTVVDHCSLPATRVALPDSGGPWATMQVIAGFSRYRNSDGSLIDRTPARPKNMGSGSCTDSYNVNLVGVGTDGQCYCKQGRDYVKSLDACLLIIDRFSFKDRPDQCTRTASGQPGSSSNPSFGNPIQPLSGRKLHAEDLGMAVGPYRLSIVYDNAQQLPYAPGSSLVNGSPAFGLKPAHAIAANWTSSLHKSLVPRWDRGVQASRGSGRWVSFTRVGSSNDYTTDADVTDTLVKTTWGWRYRDAHTGALEDYNTSGQLVSVFHRSGSTLSYEYSNAVTPFTQAQRAGLLIKVSDERGRSIAFFYGPNDRLLQVASSGGATVDLGYDILENLRALTWGDGMSKTFLYENPTFPNAMTGIVDEREVRHSQYGYDDAGRAVATSLLAAPGQAVASYAVIGMTGARPEMRAVEWREPGTGILWRDHVLISAEELSLQLPTGATSVMRGSTVIGSPAINRLSQPAGSGCGASTSDVTYDARGNATSRVDFNGVKSCHAYNSRNLETTRVEGLPASAACDAVLAASTVPAGARRVSTAWHPVWPLRTRVAEPERIRTFVYNGQTDPTAGSAVASCAPSTALLPGNLPIAVLCREVEQATSDADGGLGLSAVPQALPSPRRQSWTYNAIGQVLTHDGPRTDVADTTTYTYYTETSLTGAGLGAVGYTKGDLATITNAANHTTRYTEYNAEGRPRTVIDPNNTTTLYRYDLRQRLLSITRAGTQTSFSYWPHGQIRRATEADLSWMEFEYDGAHRLVAVQDSAGNRVSFTLDATGNRVAERFRDPTGSLRRTLSRTLDALGRVDSVTGRE